MVLMIGINPKTNHWAKLVKTYVLNALFLNVNFNELTNDGACSGSAEYSFRSLKPKAMNMKPKTAANIAITIEAVMYSNSAPGPKNSEMKKDGNKAANNSPIILKI